MYKSINAPYDKNLTAVGLKVAIRKLEKSHEIIRDGIYIPETSDAGGRLCKGEIISVGNEASKDGLKIGDIVMFDPYSVFWDTYPMVVTNVENVILIILEE